MSERSTELRRRHARIADEPHAGTDPLTHEVRLDLLPFCPAAADAPPPPVINTPADVTLRSGTGDDTKWLPWDATLR